MKPTISIIVPAYNAELTLRETLEAILAQTYEEWECIIINDGSTDGTLNIALEYSDIDKRIRVISQENCGTAEAYNVGVISALTEWVCICSADDVLLSNHLESMKSQMKRHPGFDVYLSAYGWIIDRDERRRYVEVPSGTSSPHEVFLPEQVSSGVYAVGACYRKDVFSTIGGYSKDAFVEDYDFFLRALVAGYRIFQSGERTSVFRYSATQKSRQLEVVRQSKERIIQSVLAMPSVSEEQKLEIREGYILWQEKDRDTRREERAKAESDLIWRFVNESPTWVQPFLSRIVKYGGRISRPIRKALVR